MVLQMESLGFDLSNPLTQKHSFLGSLLICKLIIMAELIYGCRRNQKTIGNKSQQLLDKNKEYTLLQEELKLVQEKFNVASFFAINNMLQLRCMRTEHERNIKTLKVKLGQRNMIILYIYFYLNRVGREKTQMEKQHRTDMELALEEHRTDMELALEEHKKRTAQIKDKLEEVIEEKSKEQKKCFTAFATLLNIFNVLEETFRKTKEENREAISKLSNELEALKTEYEIIKETTSHKKELSNLDNNLFVECRRLERQLLEIKDQLKRTSLENKELRTLKQPLVGKIHDLERQNYKLTKEIHELQLKHSELLALEKELNNRIWHLEGKLDDLKYDDIGDENGTN
jgi:hypothetical protein